MAYKVNIISTKAELLTSGFMTKERPDHFGCDFVDAKSREATERGVDILAIADGTVIEYNNYELCGYTVAIQHENKILSRYQHMRAGSVTVKVGDRVKKGQVIGVMGNTGYCTSSNTSIPAKFRGTHIHIGIKENSTYYNLGAWVNPIPYLEGKKTINASQTPITPPASVTPAPIPPQIGFKIGDTIEIKKTALRWATGQVMPGWVKGQRYKIYQLGNNNNRVLLAGVMSWIYEEDCLKI